MSAETALAIPLAADGKRVLYARIETWRSPDYGPVAGFRYLADEMTHVVEHYEIAPGGDARLISAEEYREAIVGFR